MGEGWEEREGWEEGCRRGKYRGGVNVEKKGCGEGEGVDFSLLTILCY